MRRLETRSSALLAILLAAVGSAAAAPVAAAPDILLSRQVVEEVGLSVGDIVRLSTHVDGEGARPFRIAGVYELLPDPFRLTAERREARLHLADLIELTAPTGDPAAAESVTRINVALADPTDADAFARDLEAKLPGLVARGTGREGDGTDPFVVLERFHVAIAAVTVIGSGAFLLSLMVMRSEERRQTAGILRLIGLTRSRVLLGVFVEGLLVAGAGAAFGLALALAMQGMFNRFFQWHYDTALVFLRVTPGIAIKCIAISVPLGVLAGVAASWTLLRRNIVALLRR
jgi:ABC-type lipoprotein release transport system permease subunit